jgi:hypothetical protein
MISGRRVWTRWKRFAHRAAEVQAVIILGLLYWIVVVPIGSIRKVSREDSTTPAWHARAGARSITVEDARRQF